MSHIRTTADNVRYNNSDKKGRTLPAMSATRVGATWVLLIAACGTQPQVLPQQAPHLPQQPARNAPGSALRRALGPLSISQTVAKTQPQERRRARQRNRLARIGTTGVGQDYAQLQFVMGRYLNPRNPEDRVLLDRMRGAVHRTKSLAPAAVSNSAGIASALTAVGLCARPPGLMWHCHPNFASFARPEPRPKMPYRLEISGAIAQLTLNDLSNAADPAWAKFAAVVAQLARSKGIVLDLRRARGSDPRPLIPWLEQMTGRKPLAPLRRARRPPELAKYIREYGNRYRTESRNAKVWKALVATRRSIAKSRPSRKPIVIVVGKQCESACELVVRVLETYTGASVVGGVNKKFGRLYRDDPALLTLAHSKVRIFFWATEFLLSSEIESKTGPTHAWSSPSGVSASGDLAYAKNELRWRLRTGDKGPRPCHSFRAYATIAAMPIQYRRKILGYLWRCSRPRSLSYSLYSDVPQNVLNKFMKTCRPRTWVTSFEPGTYQVGAANFHFSTISQWAQSPMIKEIRLRCSGPDKIR